MRDAGDQILLHPLATKHSHFCGLDSPSLNRRVSMLYQANLGPGTNKYATATEYIHAQSFNEAWIRAEMMCEPYEVVQGVWPISQLNDYGQDDE